MPGQGTFAQRRLPLSCCQTAGRAPNHLCYLLGLFGPPAVGLRLETTFPHFDTPHKRLRFEALGLIAVYVGKCQNQSGAKCAFALVIDPFPQPGRPNNGNEYESLCRQCQKRTCLQMAGVGLV